MGFFDKMKAAFNNAMADFTGENEEAYETLEEMLILSDAGMDTTEDIMEKLRRRVRDEGCRGEEQLRKMLASILTDTMDAGDNALHLDTKPSVILVVGVNGVGKTTTIGKLASRLTAEGRSVLLCAGDTFRAAAAEQITVWADRAGCDIVRRARELAAAGEVTALVDAAALGFADSDSERILAGSRGEIPAEARLARLWVDGPAPGDVMCPLGMSGRSKKVSDLLGEARIPVSERAGVPMVRTAPGGAVVWVAGVRADERFKCTAATRVAYLLRVVDAE